ncbi:MAG TPA: iron ABC transporter permease, partial [Sneathiellales bacterium]|nr:iron ABC transporter permease [Sneathiellales bacterium]
MNLIPVATAHQSFGRRPGQIRWATLSLIAASVISIPVVMVLSFVFVPATDVWHHLVETVLGRYIANTATLVVGVGLGTFVIGVATAWLVTMCRFPGQKTFEWALFLPMAVPAYVLAYTYTGMLDYTGPMQSLLRDAFDWSRTDYWFPDVRTIGGAAIMLVLVLYPYVYLLARAAFLEQSVCVIEVSRTLGCSPWHSFRRVALPLARPALATGVALAVMETLGDFGTVQYFAVDTFTTGIFRTWFGLGDPAAAAQLAAILLIFVFIALFIERRSRGAAGFHHTSTRYRPLKPFHLTGRRAALAWTACAIPVFFGFLLPGGQLSIWAVDTAAETLNWEFLELTMNTIMVAGLAAALAVLVALSLGYGLRLGATPIVRAATLIASMGYAVPGSVVAVGVLLPFAWIDNIIDGWMRENLGVSTGLLLSGTLAALIFAYLVRFLAVSFNTVEASLANVTPNMDRAARSLGKTPFQTVLRVHVPIMWGSLLTAGMLVFVDVMKELPA